MTSSEISPSFTLPTPGRQFLRALSADLLRLKGTAALWLTLGSGALPVALAFCIYYFKGHMLLKPGQNPWASYVLNSWQTTAGLLLPLFVVLLTSLLLHVENKATAWKHLFAQPLGRGAVFGSKVALLLGLNLVAQLVYAGLLLASGGLLGVLRPELLFQAHAAPLEAVAHLLGHTYVATLGLLAIQYVAGLWWRSFVAPVALGLGATIVAITLLRWEYISWVPYAAPFLSLNNAEVVATTMRVSATLAQAEWLSLGWFGLVLLLGYGLLQLRQES